MFKTASFWGKKYVVFLKMVLNLSIGNNESVFRMGHPVCSLLKGEHVQTREITLNPFFFGGVGGGDLESQVKFLFFNMTIEYINKFIF